MVFGLHSNAYTIDYLNMVDSIMLSSPYLAPTSKIHFVLSKSK